MAPVMQGSSLDLHESETCSGVHTDLVAGPQMLPSQETVAEVIAAADQFWKEHPDAYIAIHCAYGGFPQPQPSWPHCPRPPACVPGTLPRQQSCDLLRPGHFDCSEVPWHLREQSLPLRQAICRQRYRLVFPQSWYGVA